MNVCVFCSANANLNPLLVTTARDLGTALAEKGHTLVYGGGKVGLMGEVATAAKAAGGRVIGIIPKALALREIAYLEADELIVSQDMLTRKALMMERSEIFLALPGGLGTLDEILEVITHCQLGYHQKHTLLINIEGFFDPLHAYLCQLANSGFVRQPLERLYTLARDVQEAMNRI